MGWRLTTVTFFFCLSVENEPHEGKRIVESSWPVFRIHHQRSRYIYDLFYKRKAISRELYDYLLKNKYADANLIAKWKKVLCCCVVAMGEHDIQLIIDSIIAGLWEAVLSSLHPAARYQLWHHLYLSCSQGEVRRGQKGRMCTLWL